MRAVVRPTWARFIAGSTNLTIALTVSGPASWLPGHFLDRQKVFFLSRSNIVNLRTRIPGQPERPKAKRPSVSRTLVSLVLYPGCRLVQRLPSQPLLLALWPEKIIVGFFHSAIAYANL